VVGSANVLFRRPSSAGPPNASLISLRRPPGVLGVAPASVFDRGMSAAVPERADGVPCRAKSRGHSGALRACEPGGRKRTFAAQGTPSARSRHDPEQGAASACSRHDPARGIPSARSRHDPEQGAPSARSRHCPSKRDPIRRLRSRVTASIHRRSNKGRPHRCRRPRHSVACCLSGRWPRPRRCPSPSAPAAPGSRPCLRRRACCRRGC